MSEIIAFREKSWMDRKADYRQWDNLARAYGLELTLLEWRETPDFSDNKIVIVDEEGTIELEEFDHPLDCVYFFGRTSLNNYLTKYKHDYSIRIDTPNKICLFGCEAAAIVLEDRKRKWQL